MSRKNLCFFSTPILLAFFLFFNSEKANASLYIEEEKYSEIDGLISHYKSTLPTMGKVRSPENIVSFLQLFSQKKDVKGVYELVEKTRRLMDTNDPLSFVLPGFPFKSFNETKVISPGEIDLAEVLALATLDHLCQEIETIYGAGACITIVPDAIRVTCLLGVQTQRETYLSNLRGLLPSKRIHIKEIHEFASKPTTGKSLEEVALFLSARNKDGVDKEPYIFFVRHELKCAFYDEKEKEKALERVVSQRTFRDGFPENLKSVVKLLSYDEFSLYLKKEIKNENENKKTYETLERALMAQLNIETAIRKCALVNAQEAKQLSGYVEELFGNYENHIRLSVNQHHNDTSQKLPLQMIFGSTVTPWHNTLFVNSEKGVFLKHRDTFKDGYLKKETYKGVTIKWISQVNRSQSAS